MLDNELPGFKELTPDMFSLAKEYFKKHPEEQKVSRKILGTPHSFIQGNGQIYAMEDTHTLRPSDFQASPKGSQKTNYLGEGTFARVKLLQREDGEIKAIRISRPTINRQDEDEIEANSISISLNKLFFSFQKNSTTTKPFYLPKNTEKIKLYHAIKLEKGIELYAYLIPYLQRKDDISLINFSFIDRLQLTISILKAIKDLHDQDIIHRDIKIENIIYDPETKKAELIDFQSAKRLDGNPFIKHHRFGTNPFIAPESLHSKIYSKKTDIFSIGVFLLNNYFQKDSSFHNRFYPGLFSKEELVFDTALPETPSVYELFIDMIDTTPEKRPEAQEVITRLERYTRQLESSQKKSAHTPKA